MKWKIIFFVGASLKQVGLKHILHFKGVSCGVTDVAIVEENKQFFGVIG